VNGKFPRTESFEDGYNEDRDIVRDLEWNRIGDKPLVNRRREFSQRPYAKLTGESVMYG
jgi:hypothetical protein